jgi:iron-sulfur cluster assembly protein
MNKLDNAKFNNPLVNYLKISENAKNEIISLIKKRESPCEGIRVGIKTRGCSGLSYTIEYAISGQNITKFDDLVRINDDILLFIDPKASMFLIGSEMIFKSDDINSGFDFVNPNEKGRCGCGESFKI